MAPHGRRGQVGPEHEHAQRCGARSDRCRRGWRRRDTQRHARVTSASEAIVCPLKRHMSCTDRSPGSGERTAVRAAAAKPIGIDNGDCEETLTNVDERPTVRTSTKICSIAGGTIARQSIQRRFGARSGTNYGRRPAVRTQMNMMSTEGGDDCAAAVPLKQPEILLPAVAPRSQRDGRTHA